MSILIFLYLPIIHQAAIISLVVVEITSESQVPGSNENVRIL